MKYDVSYFQTYESPNIFKLLTLRANTKFKLFYTSNLGIV
jgi:hypothetical protein